jgi:1,5-anhydro-D-fructose reductase (1,5-anhydro-D-mannitol-forming)
MFRVAMLSKWHVHAAGYAREVSAIPGVQIVAVWDEQPQRGAEWAKELDTEFEPDYHKLLARKDIDGVLVGTPTSMHREIITAAAEAGKHIFTEKVLAFTLADALAIAAVVKKSGVKFAISYPRKSSEYTQFIKKSLDAGMLGSPTLLLARTSHNGATKGWLPDSFFDESQAGGGAMMDFGAHPMYLSRWMLGKPVRITSMFNHFTGRALEDNAVSVIEFENKALAVVQTNFICDRGTSSFELHGTLGSITQEDYNKPVKANAPDAPADEETCEVLPSALPESLPSPLAMWAEACMKGGEVPGCGMEEAVQLSELMEGAYKSFRENRVVEFSELAR